MHCNVLFVDIDECLESIGLCGIAGHCQNLPGGYLCECPEGYVLDDTGTQCVDDDECVDEMMCEYDCDNMLGSYRCGCPNGFNQHYYWNQCVGQC